MIAIKVELIQLVIYKLDFFLIKLQTIFLEKKNLIHNMLYIKRNLNNNYSY